MIHFVNYENAEQYKDQLEAMYRWRHYVFAEQRGWKEIIKPDGRDIDQFDNEDASYLLALDDNWQFEGCVRIVPTNKPTLFSEIFPQYILRNALPRSPKVWEMSRLLVVPDKRRESGSCPPADALFTAMMELGVEEDIKSIVTLSEIKRLSHLLNLGWVIDPLGLPVMVEGEYWLAMQVEVGEKFLATTRQAYRLPNTSVFANLSELQLAS